MAAATTTGFHVMNVGTFMSNMMITFEVLAHLTWNDPRTSYNDNPIISISITERNTE
jgi:hypothetical protein